MELDELIKNRLHSIKALRQELNENAELSFEEHKTKKIIETFMNSLNINTQTFANTGVVATINEAEECIAVRADMDALPVNGVSHACGHDFHMAIALGVCQILKDLDYKKCVKFIFQPGEESEGGALPMIKEGVLEKPKVTKVIGYHVWPEVKLGTIEVTAGPSMGSVDDFHITFKGKGGHAALPYKCINPIYPAADFVQSISLKSRIEHDPQKPHILTVSSIQCGNVPNVIADEAKVLGTVRTFDSEQRNKIYEDILKTARLCSDKYNCAMDIKYDFQYPPLINNKDLTDSFINISQALLGKDKVLPLEKTFAGEDFAFFAERIPAVHFRVGISDDEKGNHPLHSPFFDANDDALFYAIYVIVNFILKIQGSI